MKTLWIDRRWASVRQRAREQLKQNDILMRIDEWKKRQERQLGMASAGSARRFFSLLFDRQNDDRILVCLQGIKNETKKKEEKFSRASKETLLDVDK